MLNSLSLRHCCQTVTTLFLLLAFGCNESPGLAETAAEPSSATAALFGHPALGVTVEEEIGAPASTVWEAVSNYNGWDGLFASIETSRASGQGSGAVRFLKLKDSPDLVVERQDFRDSRARSLGYSIIESSLPVDDYHSIIRVFPVSHQACRVEWSSRFVAKGVTPEDAEQFVRKLYSSGLADLKTLFVPRLSVQQVIPAPPEAVWKVVGNFNGLPSFLTVVASSELVTSAGTTFRIVKFADGVTDSIERLDDLDEVGRSMTYSGLGAPWGLHHYTGVIEVAQQGSGSLVTWRVSYVPDGDPVAARALLEHAFTDGLDALSQMFAS